MLTQMRLQNFKSWADTGDIRLAPITVFFGANSSGKSSLAQFLLMLKQTAESSDRRIPLHTGDDRSPVELGSYYHFVHGHRVDEVLRWSIHWRRPRPLRLIDRSTTPASSWQGEGLRFECQISQGEDDALVVDELEYGLAQKGHDQLTVGMHPSEDGNGTGKGYILRSSHRPKLNRGRPYPLPAPDRYYGFPDAVQARYQNMGFVADLEFELEQLLASVQYVGPLREYPQRSYLWSGEKPESVGPRGESTVPAVLASSGRQINRGERTHYRPLAEVVAAWLRDLGLIHEFRVESIAEHRKEYEALVRVAPGGPEVSLTDVGFGVSQALPVVVECFYADPGSVLLFEQPEIHLHPSVQSNLADLFIEAINSREDGEDRRIQLLIESHSEHFLHRLQRRIAEGVLGKEDAALYFCSVGPRGSKLTELELDIFGNITNWPPDFFGDDMEDLVAMTEAAARRQSNGVDL